jgi:ATP-dependent DNA ligase
VWAFDLLHHNGRDLSELPLFEGKARLAELIIAANAGGHTRKAKGKYGQSKQGAERRGQPTGHREFEA